MLQSLQGLEEAMIHKGLVVGMPPSEKPFTLWPGKLYPRSPSLCGPESSIREALQFVARKAPSEKPFGLWPGMYNSPMTAALWYACSSFVERARNWAMNGPAQSMLRLERDSEENQTNVLYNFSSDVILGEEYRNSSNSVYIGKHPEDLDALEGTIAVKVGHRDFIKNMTIGW